MAAVIAEPRAGSGLIWVLRDSWTVARRHLMHIRHIPEKLIDATIQPLIFVFMFAYIFGSAIVVPGGHYRDFLMPGIFMAFASMSIMVGIVHDMQTGVMDRFRSPPMARAAVLIGHTGASLIAGMLSLAVMAGAGLVVGWRPHLDIAQTLGGFGLLLLFAFALNWLGALLGLWLRSVEAAQGFGMLVMFPLTFVANTHLRADAGHAPLAARRRQLAPEERRGRRAAAAPGRRHGRVFRRQRLAAPASGARSSHLVRLMIALFLPLAVWRFRRAMAR